jgi:hypothetical protein
VPNLSAGGVERPGRRAVAARCRSVALAAEIRVGARGGLFGRGRTPVRPSGNGVG